MLATATTPVHPVIHSLPTAATIQPRLHHRAWRERVRFSNDGFCDSPASISLSRSLTMGLVAGDTTLSYRGLAELGLGIRQGWDLAADNLVRAARCPEGTCFYLRDAVHTGLIDAPPTTSDGCRGDSCAGEGTRRAGDLLVGPSPHLHHPPPAPADPSGT